MTQDKVVVLIKRLYYITAQDNIFAFDTMMHAETLLTAYTRW